MVYRSSGGGNSGAPGSGRRSSYLATFDDDSTGSSSSGRSKKPQNAFRNDGSFLEMFKKMQDKQKRLQQQESAASSSTASPAASTVESPDAAGASSGVALTESTDSAKGQSLKMPLVGKRRGGRILPTGKVKKAKADSEADEEPPKDAWSAYLAEVKRYKETTCEEDGKTRPLVK